MTATAYDIGGAEDGDATVIECRPGRTTIEGKLADAST